MIKLSVCIIAKNEESCIENCLKSIKDISSEIIVVDTGSTDNTVEISRKYAKVYHDTWEDDFSKARNKSISYATGDWILIIDPDETLTEETINNIIPFIEKNQNKYPENAVFGVKIISNSLVDEKFKFPSYRHSLFRNHIGIKFKQKIHEHLFHPDFDLLTVTSDILVFIHNDTKSSDYIIKKNQKYANLLLNLANTSKDKFDIIFYSFHLGNTLYFLKENQKAIDAYNKALILFDSEMKKKYDYFYVNLLSVYFRPLLEMKRYIETLNNIEQLLLYLPGFPDALYYKGFCHQHLGNTDKAVSFYSEALNIIEKNLFNNKYSVMTLGKTLSFIILQELSKCFLIIGNIHRSLNISQYLYENLPDSLPVKINLVKNYILNDDLINIQNFDFIDSLFSIGNDELKEVVKLGKNHKKYKDCQIQILEKMLILIDDFVPEERNILTKKIDSLFDF